MKKRYVIGEIFTIPAKLVKELLARLVKLFGNNRFFGIALSFCFLAIVATTIISFYDKRPNGLLFGSLAATSVFIVGDLIFARK